MIREERYERMLGWARVGSKTLWKTVWLERAAKIW
jgi:hypothetical protein